MIISRRKFAATQEFKMHASDRPEDNQQNLDWAPTTDKASPVEICNRLRALSSAIEVYHSLKKGQIVQWKDGLRNADYPTYGQPAIIRGEYDGKLIIGMINEDVFVFAEVEKSRFEPYLEKP